MDVAREHIHIRVGLERPRAVQRRRPRLALLAAGDTRSGYLSDRWPGFRIREVRQTDGRVGVEHVRLPRGADTASLPGLDAGAPTLLRDAVRIAFDVGVDTVDLLVVRREGALPWELADPSLPELVDPFLQDIRGVPLVIPDASGPISLGLSPDDPTERLGNAVLTAFLWAPILTEHFAVGVIDLPPAPAGLMVGAMSDLAGTDFAVAAWEGPASAMRRHGWRSAATLVGALLATSRYPSDTLVGQTFALRGGRLGEENERMAELGAEDPRSLIPDAVAEQMVRVVLDARGVATVASDPALRNPLGTWTLPMLRTAKLIHHRIVIAAEQFVFRPTTQEQAITLAHALRLAVSDFERHGLLVGPNDGPSRIVAVAAPDRTEPALIASVTSFLRPWLRKIHVDLAVRAGQPPLMRAS